MDLCITTVNDRERSIYQGRLWQRAWQLYGASNCTFRKILPGGCLHFHLLIVLIAILAFKTDTFSIPVAFSLAVPFRALEIVINKRNT